MIHKTIVPELIGGVGNQMFSIAVAYAASCRYNCGFNLIHNQFTGCNQGKHPNIYYNNLYLHIPRAHPLDIDQGNWISKVLHEGDPLIHYDRLDAIVESANIITLIGHFQQYTLFSDYKDEIHNLFHLDIKARSERSNFPDAKDSIIIHVRRGDYVTFRHIHCYLEADKYYKKSLEQIPNYKDRKIFIVTDASPKEIADEFNFIDYELVQYSDELDEIAFMTTGEYFIGSNGTFAWWGAFFGKYDERAYFPSNWQVDEEANNKFKTIYIPEWNLINNE